MTTTVSTKKLFTGDKWIYNCSLSVQNGKIVSIETCVGEPEHEILIPAFIDLQVYGAGGQLFSVFPTVESLQLLRDACVNSGTHYFLPTVASNDLSVFNKCITAVREYWNTGGEGCLGIHLEGPWLNPIKRGAHLEEFLHSPTLDEVKKLIAESGDVIKMITLAPECCSAEVIQFLRENKILVSAGHTNATYQEAMSGFDSGITLATHLYNAMSPLQHREPGMVGAVLHHPTVMSSIIPDGYHVDWVALQLAQQLMGSRLFVITDAVTDTNSGPYQHRLAGDKYEADGVLSGSALTMLKACNNLMRFAGIEMDEALRLCSAYPAKAIGMENEIGKLEVGYKANFISLKLIGDELVMA